MSTLYIVIFADQVFIDPTLFGIFVCGPLQSFVVNVSILGRCLSLAFRSCGRLKEM